MEIVTLERGRTRVTIMPELGGRIAQIEIFDGAEWLPLLYEPRGVAPVERDPLSWGSFVMAPWPNRVTYGTFMFRGAPHHLPRNDTAGHAIHGLTFDRPWAVASVDDTSSRLRLELDEPWAWPSRVTQQIEVLDDGVAFEIEVAGDGPFPAGVGWHPWFRRDVRSGSNVRVLVDADEQYELAFDLIPNGRLAPVEGERDLRSCPMVGNRWLDDCYRGVRQPIRIAWGDIELTMTSSANVTHAVVYTPEHAVCIEPQTCAIDAFNLDARGIDAGTAVVDSGRPLIATTEWRWSIS